MRVPRPAKRLNRFSFSSIRARGLRTILLGPFFMSTRPSSESDRALAKVGHHWLGLDDNNSGALGSEGGGELLSELFGGVRMYRSASESGCDGDNSEAREVHAGDAGGLLQQSERLEDGVFLITHHDEHNREMMLGGRPYRLHRVLERSIADGGD